MRFGVFFLREGGGDSWEKKKVTLKHGKGTFYPKKEGRARLGTAFSQVLGHG